MAEVATQFSVLFGAQTGCAIAIFILSFLAFPSYPKYSPSIPDSKKRHEKISQKYVAQTESYIAQLRQLILDKDFMMMTVSCAIEHGVFLSILALDNRVYDLYIQYEAQCFKKYSTVHDLKLSNFLSKKLQKNVTIWEHLPKRYHFWTIINLECDNLRSWTVFLVCDGHAEISKIKSAGQKFCLYRIRLILRIRISRIRIFWNTDKAYLLYSAYQSCPGG